MRNRLFVVAAGLAALTLWGCDQGLPNNIPIQTRVELNRFEDCGELEKYIEDTAVLDMTAQLEAMKQYGGRGWWGPVAMEDGAGAPTSGGDRGPSAYTTTNTQVAGVDEADFVKNDGTRIFVLSGNTLYASRSWPATDLAVLGKFAIEGWPQEMYLDGNTVVVFSSVYTAFEGDTTADRTCIDSFDCGYYYSNTLKITVVDVTQMNQMRATGEVYLPGYYNSSRRIGSSVRIVSSDWFRWPSEMKWWPEYQPGLWEDQAMWAAAIDQLIADNTKVIRAQNLEKWLPHGRYRAPDGSMHVVGYNCQEFSRTNAPTKLGLVSVLTLNLDPAVMSANQGPTLDRVSIVAEPGEIYASQQALYVASGHWWWWPEPGQLDYTYLHKFDITDPSTAVHVASGGVDGHIVDQFSMDEHNGFFRVATTISRRVPDSNNPSNWWGTVETTNRISVLGQDGTALSVVGRSEDVAAGERIFSSRFMGNKGYVVTFRQIDPFFTFDLTDPTNPRRVGELKVPGFSTYMHPLDENHLLALGELRDENGGWTNRAMQLAIYDVTDFAHPVQAFTQTVGTSSGYSEAMWDHKAFNYFGARGLLAIPFTDWSYSAVDETSYWTSFISDLRVFGISTTTGFTPKGSINMRDLYQAQTYEYGGQRWTWYFTPYIRRSVMADEFVYAISDAGIRVANVNSLETPIATALFERWHR